LASPLRLDAQHSIPYIEQFSDLACRDEPRMKQSRNGVPGNAALNLGEWNCVPRHIEGFLAGAVRDELRFTFNFDLPRFPSPIVRGNWNARSGPKQSETAHQSFPGGCLSSVLDKLFDLFHTGHVDLAKLQTVGADFPMEPYPLRRRAISFILLFHPGFVGVHSLCVLDCFNQILRLNNGGIVSHHGLTLLQRNLLFPYAFDRFECGAHSTYAHHSDHPWMPSVTVFSLGGDEPADLKAITRKAASSRAVR